MATSTVLALGHSCEFIDSVPEDFYCKKCTLVARRLTICSSCMESYCYACITHTQKQGKPCPTCGEEHFQAMPQVKYQKRMKELQVYCSMKERGCGWSGTLDQLDTHLDPDQDNCQYVDTKCSLNCPQTIPKNKVEKHVAQHCAKRPYVCHYCNFKATYEEVVDTHLPECKKFPLQCPNLCGMTFEREFMEDHLRMCHLEEVGCEFSGVGCEERFKREDQEEHTRQNSQKHLTLTASLAKQLQQKLEEQDKKHREEELMLRKKMEEQEKELEKKMEEQEKNMEKKIDEQEKKRKEEAKKLEGQEKKLEEQEKKMEEQEKKMEDQDKAIGELKEVLKEQQEQKLKEQEQLRGENFSHKRQDLEETSKGQRAKSEQSGDTDVIRELVIEQRTFEVNYSTEIKNEYTSPAMYTHPNGYKFYARVYVSALNHLCVALFSMPGEYDDHLQWPARAKFTIELINQQGGKKAELPKDTWIWNKPEEVSNITSGPSTCMLETSKLDDFLVNNTLHFRIPKVELL